MTTAEFDALVNADIARLLREAEVEEQRAEVAWLRDQLSVCEREADIAQRRVIDAEQALERAETALAAMQRRMASEKGTARNAIASTFGLRGEQYHPEIET